MMHTNPHSSTSSNLSSNNDTIVIHHPHPHHHNNNNNHNNNNIMTSPSFPLSLLSAFYSLSASPIPTTMEIHDGVGRSPNAARSHNPGKPLCIEDRQRIVRLYEEGNRVSHIARLIGVTHSCVSKIMSRYRRTGSVQPRSFRGIEGPETSQWQTESSRIEAESPRETTTGELKFSIEKILSTSLEEEMRKVQRSNFKGVP